MEPLGKRQRRGDRHASVAGLIFIGRWRESGAEEM